MAGQAIPQVHQVKVEWQRGFELQESHGRHPALGDVVHEVEHDLHGLLLAKTGDIVVGAAILRPELFAAPVHQVQGDNQVGHGPEPPQDRRVRGIPGMGPLIAQQVLHPALINLAVVGVHGHHLPFG